jgi:hypothetical protein
VPVQTLIVEAPRYLGKGRSLFARPPLPLTYRLRLGRRFDPPSDVRAFTAELERYFTRELARDAARSAAPIAPSVEEAPQVRG